MESSPTAVQGKSVIELGAGTGLVGMVSSFLGLYRKISKIWTPQTIAIIVLKNRKVWCNIAWMHPKDADGMANSIDPDQTASSEAVWSWSALFAETYLSQYIEFVW